MTAGESEFQELCGKGFVKHAGVNDDMVLSAVLTRHFMRALQDEVSELKHIEVD